MISRRLTKTQKAQILESYRAGDNTTSLAEKFNCTTNTINRTVKTLLSESEYTFLKKNRSKISNQNEEIVDSQNFKKKDERLEQSNSLISFSEKIKEEDELVILDQDSCIMQIENIAFVKSNDTDSLGEDSYAKSQNKIKYNLDKNNQNFDNNFEEIVPLVSSFDFDLDKRKSDFKILNYESLPESVYMIVDKKVELDFKPISDFPEWSFLPENELNRNAIMLFANQRSAKRSCSKNQRVIKIPNTSIFRISKSYLISRGITRLIIEDLIIALDD